MLIFAIDDEPNMLRHLHMAISDAVPGSEIMDFTSGLEALNAIKDNHFYPIIVFSDIHMPKLDGLELAVRLKEIVPDTKIVFVTGYNEYALDAFQVHASGYLIKPVESKRIREEIEHVIPHYNQPSEVLRVQCFGKFEVFWQGNPVHFKRLQTKELFAYLIDQNGASCTYEEIALAIWEGETDSKVLSHRLRNLVSDLRSVLGIIGQTNVIIKSNRTIAVNRNLVDCDYFHMMDGDPDAVNSYRGVYMKQYSWARVTEGNLHFKYKKNK